MSARFSMRSFGTSFRNLAASFPGLNRSSNAERLDGRFPRLIERNLPYHQSRNKIYIQHRNARQPLYRLLQYNWYHVFLRLKTVHSVVMLLSFWTVMVMAFGYVYYAIDRTTGDKDCGLGTATSSNEPISFHGAFGFSLETATTVGYSLPGTSNALFESCFGITLAIYLQMMFSMLFNAFLFAFFFSRLAKSESRAIQVVFSDKCVIRLTERGTILCQFRVYDVDTGHGVVEAHVRLYALLKHKDADGHPRMEQLRLISPNDDLGAVLFLNIPTVVTHEVDYYSPLFRTSRADVCNKYRLPTGGLLLRQVDSITGNREEIMCPVCGETYGDFDRLRKHVKYQQLCEKKDEIPVHGSHRELNLNEIPHQSTRPSTLDAMQTTLPLQELICVVEGIDPLSSGTFQALHSYMPEDIEWNAAFVPCITSTTALDATFVDLSLFHQTKSTLANESNDDNEEEEEANQENARSNGNDEKAFLKMKHNASYGLDIV